MDLCDHLMSTRDLHSDYDQEFYMSSKQYDANGYGHDLNLLIISH